MAQKDVYELFHLFYINYMGPVYELLHKHPLERDIIHADETPCQVLKEDGKPAQSNAHPLFIQIVDSNILARHSIVV